MCCDWIAGNIFSNLVKVLNICCCKVLGMVKEVYLVMKNVIGSIKFCTYISAGVDRATVATY